jgi:hypothetical protein
MVSRLILTASVSKSSKLTLNAHVQALGKRFLALDTVF